jgi:hypothetical protein
MLCKHKHSCVRNGVSLLQASSNRLGWLSPVYLLLKGQDRSTVRRLAGKTMESNCGAYISQALSVDSIIDKSKDKSHYEENSICPTAV